jgi:hypothetical protein
LTLREDEAIQVGLERNSIEAAASIASKRELFLGGTSKILTRLALALVLAWAPGTLLAPRTAWADDTARTDARSDRREEKASERASDSKTDSKKKIRNAAALADACLERFDDKLGDAAERARDRAVKAHPPTTLAAQGAELARVSDKAGDERERAWVRGTARRDAHLLRVFDHKGDSEERDRAGERRLAKNVRDLKNGKIPQASDVGLAKESQDERNEKERIKREDLKASGTKDERTGADSDERKAARDEAQQQRLEDARAERKQDRADRKQDTADDRKDPGAGAAKSP